jgi:hypothetical protein
MDVEKLRATKLEWLRNEVKKGINSGAGRPLEQVVDELKARYSSYPTCKCLGGK